MCMLLLCTTFKEKQSEANQLVKCDREEYAGSWKGMKTIKGGDSERWGGGVRRGIPDMCSLARQLPSFYLSAGLRPVGIDRRAMTGRHHSRTLASSRTSRAEAEHSLPPAGRRLTGRRWRPSA